MIDLTPAQREAYARAQTSVNDLFSVELRHSTFPQPVRLITYDQDISITLEGNAPANPGETVVFQGVSFKRPDQTVDTEPGNTLTVVASGISNQVLPYLNVANETLEPIAATVRWVAYDVRTAEVIGMSRPSEMQVRNFRTGMLSVQMTLGFTNLNTRTLDV